MSTVIGARYTGRQQGKRPHKIERRKAARHIALKRFPVRVYPLVDTDEELAGELVGEGVVTDISFGGIGLILDRPLRQGMAVVIVLNAGLPGEHQLTASTLWAGELPSIGHIIKPRAEADSGYFRIGLRFEGDESEREFVAELIAESDG